MILELRLIAELLFLGLVAVASLFLVLKEKRLLIFLITPLIVLAGIDSYNSANSLLGFSRPNYYPEGEVTVISLAVEKLDWIHIWYMDPEANQPRAIKIPATEENKDKARQILQKLERGQQAFIQFKGKKEGAPGSGSGSGSRFLSSESKELIIYDFSTRYSSRKNAPQ
jgi:hypothetical protein